MLDATQYTGAPGWGLPFDWDPDADGISDVDGGGVTYTITEDPALRDRLAALPFRHQRWLTAEEVHRIRTAGEDLAVVARSLGVSGRTVWRCRRGDTYRGEER